MTCKFPLSLASRRVLFHYIMTFKFFTRPVPSLTWHRATRGAFNNLPPPGCRLRGQATRQKNVRAVTSQKRCAVILLPEPRV